ncbi:MAG: ABC transporter permease [Catenulispora sp.]|nr:ABC transporter permease [Catenulispora sp.]
MFVTTYLRRELRHRKRQAVFTALGLAVAIGTVISVASASSGAAKAQSTVLKSLYGVGTDISVTVPWSKETGAPGHMVQPGDTAQQLDFLDSPAMGLLDASSVPSIAGARGVSAAVGALILQDTKFDMPAAQPKPGQPEPQMTPPKQVTVDGVDPARTRPGPLAAATVSAGRGFGAADTTADVALVSTNYANANSLHLGGTVTVAKHAFTIVGLVDVPQNADPRDVYLPLARAQAVGELSGKVNTVYVTATSAADVDTAAKAIKALQPRAAVTTADSLAKAVTGSLADTAKLADNLGRWLSVAVLAAAFAMASLLTITSVSRRVREFGTLKALGWPTRRVTGQIMAEAAATGAIGAALGVGLGFAGAAVITRVAPALNASVASSPGSKPVQGMIISGDQGQAPTTQGFDAPDSVHTIVVHLTAAVTLGAVVLAVALALAGGLIAGGFGSWRAARMRPAEALARVE